MKVISNGPLTPKTKKVMAIIENRTGGMTERMSDAVRYPSGSNHMSAFSMADFRCKRSGEDSRSVTRGRDLENFSKKLPSSFS
ncbi:MAG: hypothetical protein ACP5UO_03735 [Thermoplasmata archaeon]